MGSFWGHIIPGSMFFFVGLWHLSSSTWSYVKILRRGADTASFRAKTWHPVSSLKGHWRFLELYILLFGIAADLAIELLYSTHFQWFENGKLSTVHMNNFEHGAMLLTFFIYTCAALLKERTRYLPLPEGTLHLIVAIAFGAEFLLFYFHSTSHQGLEGRYHILLVMLIGICMVCALLASWEPSSVLIDTFGSLALLLQGAWFYQIAFALYAPASVTRGCHGLASGDIVCDSPDATMYAMQIANLQFSWLIAAALVFSFLLYAVCSCCVSNGEVNKAQALQDGHGPHQNGNGYIRSNSPTVVPLSDCPEEMDSLALNQS